MALTRFNCLIPALALIGFPLLSSGHGYRVGSIRIVHPWVQITASSIPGKTSAYGYMVLRNTADKSDKLISAFAEIAEKVELRATDRAVDTPAPRQVDSIAIPAGSEVRLEPGGPHLMLMGVKKPLAEGQHFSFALQFGRAGNITVDMFVQAGAGDAIY